jgi:hypothetical protein
MFGSIDQRGHRAPSFMVIIYLWVLFSLTGCGTTAFSPKGTIDQLHLLVTSVALNMDGKPGADGVGVRVYASHRGSSEATPIMSGSLEILMFDGQVPFDELPKHQPLRSWTYPAAELKPHLQKTAIGSSYAFAAVWGNEKPKGDRVTVVARYRPETGSLVYSAPGSIPLSAR